MNNQDVLNASYEIARLFFLLFAIAQIWALIAWPPKSVTRKYPLSTRLLLAWPFGAAWIDRIEPVDIQRFEKYQRRSRVGCYFGLIGTVLFVLSVFGTR